MGGQLKNIAKISAATIGSRVLGFARDAATMAYLGLSAVNAAYTFAFTLPNLFRRLLGEGALSSAMIPIFAQSVEKSGKEAAFGFLNKVLTRTAILLAALTIIGMSLAFAASEADIQTQRFHLGASYLVVLMPYMFMICLAAVFGSALNVLGSFGMPSIGPMLLNISIICGIFIGAWLYPSDDVALGYAMCAAWLVGGFLQMLIPAVWTYKKGWRFKFDLGKSDELGELYALFVPALTGAAIIQVNIFVSKMLALWLNDSAIPALYLASRLLEFPLGVFTIAIATVFFPRLSALKASDDTEAHKREYAKGFLMTLAVAIPATFGLVTFAPDIIALLFQWGVFKARDVDICTPVVIAAVSGLPFFSIATFATRGFHSSKDTKTPVKISAYSFAANIALSLILMKPFGAAGLAAANAGAAALQAWMLSTKLKMKFGKLGLVDEVGKIFAASAVMTLAALGLRAAGAEFFQGKGLACTVADSTYVKTLPAGSILDYTPTAGQRVKKGRIVYLTINTLNIPLCNVPDVADNSSVREAQARLLAAGFKLTPNDSVPGEQDWVYYVRHGEDTLNVDDQVPTGATLTLIIGNGEPIPAPADSLSADSLGLMRDSIPADLPEDESWF